MNLQLCAFSSTLPQSEHASNGAEGHRRAIVPLGVCLQDLAVSSAPEQVRVDRCSRLAVRQERCQEGSFINLSNPFLVTSICE